MTTIRRAHFFRTAATWALAWAGFAGSPAHAGTLFVSGDSNIANPLTGSFNSGISLGNQTFFTNVLQGGSEVRVLESTLVGSVDLADTDIVTFYNTLPGVTAALVTGTVTSATLAGANLFVSVLPDDAFSVAEVSVLNGFLQTGGTVFLLGENSGFAAPNGSINAALTGLGSSLRIVPDAFDNGFNDATGAQIGTGPFTAGVTSFRYAAPSQVAGGTALFFGSQQQPFVTYEFTPQVPEPASLALFAAGLAGLLLARNAAHLKTRFGRNIENAGT